MNRIQSCIDPKNLPEGVVVRYDITPGKICFGHHESEQHHAEFQQKDIHGERVILAKVTVTFSTDTENPITRLKVNPHLPAHLAREIKHIALDVREQIINTYS